MFRALESLTTRFTDYTLGTVIVMVHIVTAGREARRNARLLSN